MMSEKKEGREQHGSGGHDAGGSGGRGSRKPGHKDASGHRERRFDGPDDVPMLRYGARDYTLIFQHFSTRIHVPVLVLVGNQVRIGLKTT
jgi:hypothetical protein